MMQEQTARQALIVLPGLTADRQKRESMFRFFSENTSYAVYIANIPNRHSLKVCVKWLDDYLTRVVGPGRFQAVQVLAYISGGVVLRHMASSRPIEHLANVVYVRSPIQELTMQVLRRRYGRFLLWVLRGRLLLDVAAADLERLAYPSTLYGQGLVIETGVSRLARSLGVSAERVPTESWEPDGLLPGADDVIRVPESHDDVYTSESLLRNALHFFTHGRFQASETSAVNG
jgi:hypothetical protein